MACGWKGETALVTGVSRRVGIGFAIARRLQEDGAHVFVHGWAAHDAAQPWGADPGGTAAVADELGLPFVEADFADPDAPRRVVEAVVDAVGPIDILIANHARSGHGRLGELTAEEIDAFLHENVRASLLLVKEFAARHDDSRAGGRVVLFTSGQHLAPMAHAVAYAVSKGALQQATLTLADELADRRITVNTVNPGPTDTGWGLAEQDPAERMPFGRWAEPEDVARLVAWLCSDEAAWITGQTIDSEGGFRRWRD
ncbi:MAG TPA: SDR family oxidoreductase [Gaiellaceae bacterium]|nr:SDR family oxidoreductase [Gaiellaceae bacterium]